MTARHRRAAIVKITCFCVPKIIRVDEFACHRPFSQNARGPLAIISPGLSILHPASCTVISEQLGPHSVVLWLQRYLCFVQRGTGKDTPPHGVLHCDHSHSTIPMFISNTYALKTAQWHTSNYTSHHSSTRTAGLSQHCSVVIPSQNSSRRPTIAPRTQHLLYGPYSSQTDPVRQMQSCFQLWTGSPPVPHHRCPIYARLEHHHLLSRVANACHSW